MTNTLATHRAEAHHFESQDRRFPGRKNAPHHVDALSLSLSVVGSIACASDSKSESTRLTQPLSGPGAGNDDGGDHGADQPWVDCRNRKHQRAADPFGPVISHGVREAPGFRPGRFNASARRAFRRASLQGHPDWPTFLLSDIELPSASPTMVELEELIESAVDLAGRQVPANATVLERRELTEAGATRRMWTAGFFHEDVRVSPAECDLSVESGQTTAAILYCRLPLQAPTRFEPFQLAEDSALDIARNAAELPAGYGDIERLLVADGPIASAHFYAVLSDGRREIAVELDGQGNVLAVGDNTKPFTFNGYDLDYTVGVAERNTPIPVGSGQGILDTAPVEAGKQNCVGQGPQQYARGFAICYNDVLRDVDGALTQPLVAPRPDLDFTNPPDSFDPLPPQVLDFASTWGGEPVHGVYDQVASRPTDSNSLLAYVRDQQSAPVQAVGPAHHAELQAFYNMAKLQRFYALLDPKFVVNGQDRFRTEVTVHWNPELDGLPPNAFRFRAGRRILKMGAFENPAEDLVEYDGPGGGDVFAHEYHHHIQESLAQFAGWQKFVTGEDLFPFPPSGSGGSSCGAECRRAYLLEGTADGFSAVSTRGIQGTLGAAHLSPSELAVCSGNRGTYQTGVGPAGVRRLCNNEAFGFWESGPGLDPVCHPGSGEQYKWGVRQLILGGGMYLYQQRFRQAGIGPGFFAQHLLQAERKLQRPSDNEMFYLGGLLAFLAAQPGESARRYVHIARAAFAEKGVFPPLAHIWGGLGLDDDIDKRPQLSCDTATCDDGTARGMSSASITAGGPLEWTGGAVPTFEIFAPFGSRYQRVGATGQIVYFELSSTAAFAQQQRQLIVIDTSIRTNCAPAGFALKQPSSANWQAAVAAAEQGSGRVYYRLRQCLASASGPDDPINCIVSANAQTPAFIEIDVPGGGGGGCSCRTAGERSPTTPWSMLLITLGVVGLGMRRWS